MDLLNNRNRTFIASHSGMFCGNLVRNTIPAFEAAVKMGADILEVDVAKTKDDRLILFHTGTEKLAFGKDISVQNCTLQELKTMRLKNSSGGKTIYYVDLLDDFLEHFKGRAIINIDRAWDIFEDVAAAVRRHGMVNEVFMKADCSDNHWEKAQAVASDIPFMPILSDADQIEKLKCFNLKLVAAELNFPNIESPLVSKKTMDMLHKMGMLLWANAIVFYYGVTLAGGFTDDVSVTVDPELGWGRLIDMGFDIIQTDYPETLYHYLNCRNKERDDTDEKIQVASHINAGLL